MYGFQAMRTQNNSELDADVTDDDIIAEALQNEELDTDSPGSQNPDTFSRIYEFLSSLWSGDVTHRRKNPTSHDHLREILPAKLDFDVGASHWAFWIGCGTRIRRRFV